MMNIMLSFFILVFFSNVKAATLQDANNSRPQSVGYASVVRPTVIFSHEGPNHTEYLDIINNTFRDKSENMKYEYQGSKYHCVITDFCVSLNNSSKSLKKKFSKSLKEKICKKGKEELIKGSAYFIAYIQDNIKCLISQHLHKYDFHSNYNEVKTLANDLKALIYDGFDNNFKNNLIKYETEPEDEKLHKKAKKFLEALINNSSIRFKGYFIKIREDGNYIDFNYYNNYCFDININKGDAKSDYYFRYLEPEDAELLTYFKENPNSVTSNVLMDP
ncbi:Protein of unknown function (DUF3271), putative [Plasmodium chabaudi adami]|uniref:Fam-d protein n=1 Tax=Plasmodium chabaudi adami TaxID=5826 RepID=A0A1D3RWB5_PLACE|nr:Protein of unknown function (DUF3271), putative [Plasmodium chabaudi adami]